MADPRPADYFSMGPYWTWLVRNPSLVLGPLGPLAAVAGVVGWGIGLSVLAAFATMAYLADHLRHMADKRHIRDINQRIAEEHARVIRERYEQTQASGQGSQRKAA